MVSKTRSPSSSRDRARPTGPAAVYQFSTDVWLTPSRLAIERDDSPNDRAAIAWALISARTAPSPFLVPMSRVLPSMRGTCAGVDRP